MASMLLSSPLQSSSTLGFPNLKYCSSFRSTSNLKSRNFKKFCCAMSTGSGPGLMMPPVYRRVYNFYSLPQNKISNFINKISTPIIAPDERIVGSSHGWLALLNVLNRDLCLSNPITGCRIALPHTFNLPISLSSFNSDPEEPEPYYRRICKVIINCDDPESQECRVIMIFGVGHGLAYCCPRLSTEWTLIGDLKRNFQDVKRDYEDIVFSNKSLFCLTGMDTKELECWDVGDLHSPKLLWSNKNDLLGDENYLSWYNQAVESLNQTTGLVCCPFRYLVAAPDHQLFLVTRFVAHPPKSIAFDVHKIDWDEDGGMKLSSVEGTGLGGLAIFVGLNHSFAVSASDHQLKPNSIYFTDSSPNSEYHEHDIGIFEPIFEYDIGIFDYESRTVSPSYYPCEPESFFFRKIVPGPVWFTPTQTH